MSLIPERANRPDWPRLVARENRKAQQAIAAATNWGALQDFADDAAAATGGVEVGQLYRNGSVVQVRVS